MNKTTKILLIVLLCVIFMINNHIMDISNNTVWAYNINIDGAHIGTVEQVPQGTSNGFWSNNDTLYHLTWYMNYLIIFTFTYICISCINKN